MVFWASWVLLLVIYLGAVSPIGLSSFARPLLKCDVVFLQSGADRADILVELEPRPGIEDALYIPGAVIWRVDRKDATRSRLTRIVGTPLYRRVTVRNCNTTRRLLELLRA